MRVTKTKNTPGPPPWSEFSTSEWNNMSCVWTTRGNSLCKFCARHCSLLITDAGLFSLEGCNHSKVAQPLCHALGYHMALPVGWKHPGLYLHDRHSTSDLAGVTISHPFYKVITDNIVFDNLLPYRVHANSVEFVCLCSLHFRGQVEKLGRYPCDLQVRMCELHI